MSRQLSEEESQERIPGTPQPLNNDSKSLSNTFSDLRLDLRRLKVERNSEPDGFDPSFGLSESLHHETARYSMHLENHDLSIINEFSSRTILTQDALGKIISEFNSVKDQLLPVIDSDSDKSGIVGMHTGDANSAANNGSSQCERVAVQFDQQLAICLVGAQDTGKTRLFNTLLGQCYDGKYKTTIAADFGVQVCNNIKFLLFDSPGEDQLLGSAIAECAEVDIVLLLYTNEKRALFDRARLMHKKIKEINPTVFFVLVCAKFDAFEICDFNNVVDQFIKKNEMQLFTVSCVELFDPATFLRQISTEFIASAAEMRKQVREFREKLVEKHRQILLHNSAILSARSQSIIANTVSYEEQQSPGLSVEKPVEWVK